VPDCPMVLWAVRTRKRKAITRRRAFTLQATTPASITFQLSEP
jgi:hypothetical protein